MLLSECINEYIKVNTPYIKEKTIFEYNKRKDRIIKEFGDIDIDTITQEFLQNYINSQQQNGKSCQYIRNILCLVIWALKPYKKFDKLRYKKTCNDKKEKEIYTNEDVDKIEQYILTHNKYTYKPIMIAINTGMRLSEISGLKWEDIDFDNCIIKVERNISKNGKYCWISEPKTLSGKREIPMNDTIFNYLQKNVCGNKDYYVITNSQNIKNQRSIQKTNDALCKKLGIKPLGMHAYRHTFATRLLKTSQDFKAISRIMGHSSIAITQEIYNHPTNEQKEDVIKSAFNENKEQPHTNQNLDYQPQIEYLQNQINELRSIVSGMAQYIKDKQEDMTNKQKEYNRLKKTSVFNQLGKTYKNGMWC